MLWRRRVNEKVERGRDQRTVARGQPPWPSRLCFWELRRAMGLQRAKENSGHTRNSGGVRAGVPTRSVRSADFVSNPARFVFERAGGEFGARATVAEILVNERLKATTSFTLSDVDELVQDQFAITPAIGANNNSIADGRAARSISDDMGEPRGLSELLVVRQRNSIDHQHFHPGTIPNPDSMRIGGLPWP